VAASFADQVLFLVDGRIVSTLHMPTPEQVAGQLAGLRPVAR
jgi:hypothetical protein